MYVCVYMLINCLASVTAYSSKGIMIYRYIIMYCSIDRRGASKNYVCKNNKTGLYEVRIHDLGVISTMLYQLS